MDGMKMKKIIAVVLIAALAIGSIFASPLTLTSNTGSAKVYDETFKSVSNVDSVKENWIIRTSDNEVNLKNDGVTLTIGENSLVQIINLDENSPVVYLLDGSLIATTEGTNLTVNTTVTSYNVAANSSVVVISTETSENGYVHEGNMAASNNLTGVTTSVEEGNYLDLSLSGSKPEKPAEDSYISSLSAKFPTKEKPVAEPVVEVEAAVEVIAEEPAEEEVLSPLTKTFSYAGYEATITAYVGQAIVEYPSFVTAQEIYTAALVAYNAYPEYLQDVYIEVVEDGKAVVTYPETYGEAEFNIAVSLLEKELPYYIASLFETETEEVTIQPVEIVVKSEPAEPKTELVIVPLTKTFSYAGYEATITANIGQAIVEYPSFVTAQEIYAAALAAYNAYPEYLQDVYIEVVEDGKAVITYPETYGEAEFNLAVSLLEKELPYYIASLFEAPEPEIYVDYSEPVVIEIVAPDSPAQKPDEKTEQPVEEATTAEAQPEAEAQQPTVEQPVETKEKANVKFGATIGVVYGQYTEGSEYKPFIDAHYIRRIGFAPKNVIVNVDPYLTVGNLTIGLHASIDVQNLKDSFKFTTNKGISGYINSVFSYVGRISYNSDKLNINLDRNHSVEFSSPVFASMDKAFDTNNSLVASGSLNLGFVTASAFVDDLQLTSHLNGKNQYAGAMLTSGSKHVTVNISVIASALNRKNINFYPAIDATAKIETSKLNVEIYAGIASLFEKNNKDARNLLVKGNLNLSTNVFSFGVGAAYNLGAHINDTVSNSPVNVVKPFNGEAIDVLLSAGLDWGVLSINGSMSLPLSLNTNGGHLAYNTVKTRSGNQINITADVLKVSAKLDFNWLSLSGGLLFEGFSGRLANFAKALVKKSGRRSAVAGLVDSELATIYAQMTLSFGNFEAYARGDMATIEGYKRVSTSFGASYSF